MNAPDDTRRPRPGRDALIHGALLLALLAALYPAVFFRGELPLPGGFMLESPPWNAHAPADPPPYNPMLLETLVASTAWYAAAQSALAEGVWPLWNPLQLTGVPILANYQSAIFYPFRLLHVVFGLLTATSLYLLLKLWLCGMTAFLCGRGLRLGLPAARFLSVGWMLSHYNLVWVGQPVPDVAAWLPLLFLGVEWLVTGSYRRGFALMLVSAILMLLAGHPETALMMGMGLGVYFFARLALERRAGPALWTPIALAALAWAAALAVCAAQLVPFFEYLAHSDTFYARPGDELDKYSLTAGAVVGFWVPRFYGLALDDTYWWERLNQTYMGILYGGVTAWAAAALLLSRRAPGGPDRRRVVALLLAAAPGVLLAFRHPALDYLHALPLFSSMRPVYHCAFALFALPVLGAFAVDHWFSQARRLRELALPALCAALIAAVALAFYRFHAPVLGPKGLAGPVALQVAVSCLLLAAVLGLAAARCLSKRRFLASLPALLLAVDLLFAARGYMSTAPRDLLYMDTPLTAFLQDLERPNRIGAMTADVKAGLLQPYEIEELWGYDAMYPGRIVRFLKTAHNCNWDVLEPLVAVRYLLFPKDRAEEVPDRFTPLTAHDGVAVYEDPRALPRAYLVERLERAPDPDALFQRLCEPSFSPHNTAITDADVPFRPPDAPTDAPRPVRIVSWGFSGVVLDVDAPRESVLVLLDAYYPGWTATIDGTPAPLFPVYHAFRGVVVPAGHSRVEMRFRPRSFRVGLAVSTIALIALAAAGALALRRGLFLRRGLG